MSQSLTRGSKYSNLTWKLFAFCKTGCWKEVVTARGLTAFKIRMYNNNRFKKIKLLKRWLVLGFIIIGYHIQAVIYLFQTFSQVMSKISCWLHHIKWICYKFCKWWQVWFAIQVKFLLWAKLKVEIWEREIYFALYVKSREIPIGQWF